MEIGAKLIPLIFMIFSLFPLLFSIPSFAADDEQNFLQCLTNHFGHDSNQTANLVYDHANAPSYSSILHSSIHNLRFNTSQTPKPQYMITPKHSSHVQATVICSQKYGLQVRVRSGGHDYEGLSYTSQYGDHNNVPFVIIDLFRLRSISVYPETKTAWVEAGATIGELYYEASRKSNGILGFAAGTCHTMGVGGHISGGGQGVMIRKFGLAADNVVDAILVKANGEVVDRYLMGEDLFWAIRGGGAASFGVVLKWKVNLVPVPPKVSVCNIPKTVPQGATHLVHQWQDIAHKFHEDLDMRVIVFPGDKEDSITALFNILYLGTIEQLMPLINVSFPELRLEAKHCEEMSWLESMVENRNDSIETLKDRTHVTKGFFLAKSDFFNKPISEIGLEAVWKVMQEDEEAVMILEPYGGKMSEILESETPFPHRAGTLFNAQFCQVERRRNRSNQEAF